MAKKYPKAERGAKILTAMQFRNLWKRNPKYKHKSYLGGDSFGYSLEIKRNLRSKAFGKKGLQELADSERKRRY